MLVGWHVARSVDLNELRNSADIASKYLNLATATGGVVRKLPVFAETT